MLHLNRVFSFVFAVFLSASVATAQSVDDIINKHVEAMGGAAALSQFKSLRMEATMQVMGMEIETKTTIVHQRGYHSETEVQGMKIVQAIDGNKGWMINPMMGQTTAQALPEEAVSSMSNQIDLTGMYKYAEKGIKAELVGEESVEGEPAYILTLTLPAGGKVANYISKNSYYVIKTVVKTVVEGQEIETKVSQSNFKKVNGITYPFTSQIETPAMPGAVTMLVKNIEVNGAVDEAIFAMPKN